MLATATESCCFWNADCWMYPAFRPWFLLSVGSPSGIHIVSPILHVEYISANCITSLANLHKCMLRIESKYRSQEILQEDASSIEQKSPLRQIVSEACAGWSKYNRCWENPPIRAGITEFSTNNVRIVALKSVAVRQHCQPLNY